MKAQIFISILISLLLILVSACQVKEPLPDVVCPIDEITGEYDEDCTPIIIEGEGGAVAYPPGEAAYPAVDSFNPVPEDAYPITQADLSLLLKTWRLASYAENGIESGPPLKTLTFNPDSSYTITTEDELIQGTWSTILLAMESTLILTPDSGDVGYYQIIDLADDALNLRTVLETIQIDEGYKPGE
jgi:hypothetical protein